MAFPGLPLLESEPKPHIQGPPGGTVRGRSSVLGGEGPLACSLGVWSC